jgi:hypothetical protein
MTQELLYQAAYFSMTGKPLTLRRRAVSALG